MLCEGAWSTSETMPLIAWLIGAYLAGLLAGFSSAGAMIGVAAIAAAAVAIVTSRARAAVAAIALAAGALSATSWTEARRSCVRSAAKTLVSQLRLDDEAAPGAFV